MTEIVHKYTRAAREALARLREQCGFDVSVVLSPDDWCVMRLPDGSVEVMVNKEGTSKLALLSPDQDKAAKFMSEFTAYLEDLNK